MDFIITLFNNSGFTALLSMVLTLLIKGLIDARSEKRKEKERFFYEIFPRRIELYKDIMKATEFISGNEEWKNIKTKENAIEFFNDKYYCLLDISYRCVVFGSHKITNAVGNLNEALGMYISKLFDESVPFSAIELVIFTRAITKAKINIAELIRKESCTDMVDNKISDFLKNIKIKKDSNESVG